MSMSGKVRDVYMQDHNPQACLYMKVGQHAGEPWENIVVRKQQEIVETGMSFWGYGGNTAPPNIVIPFVKEWIGKLGSFSLVMEVIDSKVVPRLKPAVEYSVNGSQWSPIPNGIHVLGSKYALVLKNLLPIESMLDLENFVECRRGRSAIDYIRGRVDKACLVRNSEQVVGARSESGKKKISMEADLLEPYAVYLR